MNENVEDLTKLSSKQYKAIQLTLSGKSTDEIAKELKLNSNTIYRWKGSPLYKEELKAKQNELLENSFNKIKNLSISSLDLLEDLIVNSNSENIKLKASMYVIDKMFIINQDDILERLDEIEALVKERNKS